MFNNLRQINQQPNVKKYAWRSMLMVNLSEYIMKLINSNSIQKTPSIRCEGNIYLNIQQSAIFMSKINRTDSIFVSWKQGMNTKYRIYQDQMSVAMVMKHFWKLPICFEF